MYYYFMHLQYILMYIQDTTMYIHVVNMYLQNKITYLQELWMYLWCTSTIYHANINKYFETLPFKRAPYTVPFVFASPIRSLSFDRA